MHHFFSIAFSLLAIIGQHVSSARGFRSALRVPNGGPWGTWRERTMCPDRTYATGFSLRVEKPVNGDNTALNAIRLYCVESSRGVVHSVGSDTGEWGEWTDVKWCPSGYLSAFQLRVDSKQGAGDDTAANNIRFLCSDGSEMEGQGTSWGYWGDWSPTCQGTGICGISTKIEPDQGKGDDTALNDVGMFCCE